MRSSQFEFIKLSCPWDSVLLGNNIIWPNCHLHLTISGGNLPHPTPTPASPQDHFLFLGKQTWSESYLLVDRSDCVSIDK